MTCQFVLHQILNVLVPAKDDLEHVESKVVWSAFWPEICGAEGYVAQPRFGEWKEIHVLVLLGFVWASENLFA